MKVAAFAAIFVAVAAGFFWLSQPKEDLKALFAAYDHDNDGVIQTGDISGNDHHLQRVLNIDGVAGISLNEFISKGTMAWQFIDSENWELIEDKKSIGRHVRVTRRLGTIPEGSLIPTGNPEKPFLTVDEFIALNKPMSEVQKDLNIKPMEMRRLELEAHIANPNKGNEKKFVTFDIRDPKKGQIDVLEYNSISNYSKSMPYSRSVDWVEGESAPHYVMGQGLRKPS